MSKNRKSFKKSAKNNFQIEALEPRLMMDAAPSDSDWRNELDNIDIGRCRG